MAIQVEQIDHVELVVPSRTEAANWYGELLGLERIPELEFWSDDPNGPLMLTTPRGSTKIALFRGESHGSQRGTGFHLLAFRTDAKEFLSLLNQLDSMKLVDRDGKPVNLESVCDHKLAFSIYFCDPWKNQIEVTTYDHEIVRTELTGG